MDEPIPAHVRRERMRVLIRDREFVHVADLSALFGISEVTVRSDLRVLASGGQVRRVRGGALPAHARVERPFEQAQVEFADEKAAIGAAAAALVSSQETILLDVGTTTTEVARALVHRSELHDLVVFTNGLNIALELEPAIPRFTVVVTGGTLRPLQHSLVDPLAGEFLQGGVNVETAFLGCNGVHPEAGITNVNLPEAAVKRRMLAAAQRRIVVADGSKVGRRALAHLCDVADVDLLVTDASADPGMLGALSERGLRLQVAP